MTDRAAASNEFRYEVALPLRHTDSFGGTPFVHGGVMLALTEIALDGYDVAAGIPSHREVLRMQTHSELRYLAPLRWDDSLPAGDPAGGGLPGGAAVVRLRCAHIAPGRLTFECELASGATGVTVARMTHRYAYIGAQSGRVETPADWPQIVAAIRAYEPDVEVATDA